MEEGRAMSHSLLSQDASVVASVSVLPLQQPCLASRAPECILNALLLDRKVFSNFVKLSSPRSIALTRPLRVEFNALAGTNEFLDLHLTELGVVTADE
jgi:hypothetical protein